MGKVTLTLTMGHGRLPAQALAEPATPGAQFMQHMARCQCWPSSQGTHPWGSREDQRDDPLWRPKLSGDDGAISSEHSGSMRPEGSMTQ